MVSLLINKILKEKLSSKVDKIIYHEKNLGKGACIKTGLKHVTGEVVIGAIKLSAFYHCPTNKTKVVNIDLGCLSHRRQGG